MASTQKRFSTWITCGKLARRTDRCEVEGMAINPTGKPDYKEIVSQEWLEAAPQWKKWFTKLEQQSQAGTDLLVQGAKLAPGMQVLDIASGSGQPALSIAEVVGPQGSVIATDLVPEMLEGAAAIAASRG